MTSKILSIETSCDDTSVAIVRDDGFVEVCLSANQDLVHKPFGGVVPEIASRNHTLQLLPLIEEVRCRTPFSWHDLSGIAVTSRPGLIGSLLVGVVTAKSLALVHDLKLIGVNHLEAHLLAPFLYDKDYKKNENLKFPYLAMAVSGGHTQIYWVTGIGQYKVMGRTLDDAAGEAFDKFAKHLGLGFPGGVKIDQLAKTGDASAFKFPRTMIGDESFDYSFSGLKSGAIRMVDQMDENTKKTRLSDICASFQESVADSLLAKFERAAEAMGAQRAVVTGGVSANSRLRQRAEEWANKKNIQLFIPPLKYCTDNAAMVGYAGISRLMRGEMHDQTLTASASSWPNDFAESSR